MIDPKAVILQVQQGNPPANWQIFKGKDFRFAQGIVGGVIIFVVLFLLLWGISTQYFQFDIFSNFPHIPLWFSFITVAIAIFAVRYGYTAWQKASQQKDSILVLLPDGLVHCTNYHDIEKHEYKVLSYTDITNMTMRSIRSSTMTSNRMMLTNTEYFIDITYKNGQKERWTLDIRFAPPDTTAEMIIKEYKKFRVKQAP